MQIKIILISILLVLSLTNCSSYDFSRRAVQQGNLLHPATIAKLRVGMSKDDVAVLLGSSMLNPAFDNQHWDYAYTWRKGNGPNKIKHLVIYFNNDRVVRIEHQP